MITIISIMVVVFPKERRNYGIFCDTLKKFMLNMVMEKKK